MKAVVCLLILLPLPALADLRLSQLVGDWSGGGSYAEGLSVVRVRCRLSFSGDDARVTLNGRCAAGAGGERFDLDLARAANGSIVVHQAPGAAQSDSPIDGLSGVPQDNQLVLRGAGGSEAVIMVFRLNGDGSLRFATKQTWAGGGGKSVVDLTRR